MNLRGLRNRNAPVNDAGMRGGGIIEAVQVVKTYVTGEQQVAALRDVDFSVQAGELVAVMGPSGSGKTTLLNALSGLDDVDSGQIWLEGRDLARMSDDERTIYRAQRMGFVFQVYNLLPVLNAVENVELPLLVSGMRAREARDRAKAALQRVGLEDRANHRPAELSGGQRQRVAVARALVNDPAIVWADEPTGALDSRTANEIIGLIQELNARDGLTSVIVTHDAAIGARTHRVVHMRDGAIDEHVINGHATRVAAPAPSASPTRFSGSLAAAAVS
jgi:ABC-type lipoprotein export system ATPase subunit